MVSLFHLPRKLLAWCLILVSPTQWVSLNADGTPSSLVATFSIVAWDPETGDLGVAVQSKFFGVGSVVPWAKAGVGAIATQSYANVTYGPKGLELLELGLPAREVLERLTAEDGERATRQLGLVDSSGRAAAFTGEGCHDWAGQVVGEHFAAQGNLLAGQAVVEAMAEAFLKQRAKPGTELADALMAALEAGQSAGGDKRGRQSAALLVVRDKAGYGSANDRYIDLRVEDHPTPISELQRLLAKHKVFYRAAHANPPNRRALVSPPGS